MTKKKLVLGLVFFLALAMVIAVITWRYVFREAETNVAARSVDVEISVTDLVSRFETNEEAANADLLGKVLLVEGLVESLKEDSLSISVYLKNPEDMAGVICSFGKNDVESSKVNAGTTLKVKGICTGYLLDVVLNRCVLVE